MLLKSLGNFWIPFLVSGHVSLSNDREMFVFVKRFYMQRSTFFKSLQSIKPTVRKDFGKEKFLKMHSS